MRIALGIEYDGSRFHGWQRQHGVLTLQACVEDALARVADGPVRIHCGGRTDTGVHAVGQVVHFDTEAQRSSRSWMLGTNVNLPDDVGVRWCRPVDADFHARFAARRRRYRYVILNRPARAALFASKVAWEPRPLDAERMQAAAQALAGEHDFSAYRAQGCQARHAVRSIEHISVRRRNEFVWLDVAANAFLMHMVRNIAGVLIAIGTGKAPVNWAQEVLGTRDRTRAGVTAPPQGLYLMAIDYPAKYQLPAVETEVFA